MAFAYNDYYYFKDGFDHEKFRPTEFSIEHVEGIDGAIYVSI